MVEPQPGGPGEGQGGQGPGHSGDQAWIVGGHWEKWDEHYDTLVPNKGSMSTRCDAIGCQELTDF